MPTSVKEISASALEVAIAEVIAKFTDKNCSVSISELKYNSDGFASYESLSFSASAFCEQKEADEKLPF